MRVAYLDIETNYVGQFTSSDDRFFRDSKNHLITVLGVRLLDKDSDVFVQFFDKDVTKANLTKALNGAGKIVTYNGRSIPDTLKRRVGFDFPVIAAQLGIVLDKEFPHVDLCPECWKRNLYGGQKKVEQTLGLRRQFPNREGAWAMETFRAYVKTGERKLREELLAYNREDVYMLRELELKLAKFKGDGAR
jgi:uncharacterized protein YprB with RNaseH-like and TPR domain